MRCVFLFALIGLFLLSSVSAEGNSTWSSCSSPGAHLTVTNVTLISDPPVRGKDETVKLVGTVDETVSGGSVVLTITYLGIQVFSHTYAICDVIACPYAAGSVTASLIIPGTAIPPVSPAGNYVGKAILTDQVNAQLACVQVQFTLPSQTEAENIQIVEALMKQNQGSDKF